MNRADVNRAVEEEQAYYHASRVALPVGENLIARGYKGRTTPVIDERRPAGVAPRNDHLFMVQDPQCFRELGQGDALYRYRVTPTSPVTKANFKWFRQASFHSPRRWDPGDPAKAAEAADNYWSGVPGPHCWNEYLTRSFRVDEEVERP